MVSRTTAFFLFLAYSIMLGHSIVPHHHHTDHQQLNHHHQSSHHDGEKDLNHLLSHFVHAEDGFTTTAFSSTVDFFSKYLSAFNLPGQAIFNFDKIEVPPLIPFLPPEPDCFISFLPCTSGLRAPPVA